MTRKEEKVEEKTVKTLKKENSDLRALAYKILVDKFNNKYKALLPEQKTVLKEYVNNISNTNALNEFLESKFTEISYNLKKMLPKIVIFGRPRRGPRPLFPRPPPPRRPLFGLRLF